MINTITDEQLSEWYRKMDNGEELFCNFYIDHLRSFQEPMLEINCGSGKIMHALIDKGIECEGIDSDYSQTDIPEKYYTVFVPNGSFSMITSYGEAMLSLQKLYSALKSGGKIVIDLCSPWEKIRKIDSRYWTMGKTIKDPETSEQFIYSFYDEIDLMDQTRTTHIKYDIFKNNELAASRLEEVTTRWYGIREFALMLEKAGFKEVECRKILEKSETDFSILYTATK